MSSFHDKLDAFPTQLILTILWATVGVVLCVLFRHSLLWIGLISAYANIATHWSAHLGWRAKRAADKTNDDTTTDK